MRKTACTAELGIGEAAASVLEVLNLTDLLHDLDAIILVDTDTGGVIATVLETLQGSDQKFQHLTISDIREDAAHIR